MMLSCHPFTEIETNFLLLEPIFTQLGTIKMIQNAGKM